MLRRTGITAGVIVRIGGPDPPFEVFGINLIGQRRSWPADFAERFRFLGRVLSNAVQRKQAEAQLRKRLVEIEFLRERLETENLLLRTEVSNTREGGREGTGIEAPPQGWVTDQGMVFPPSKFAAKITVVAGRVAIFRLSSAG